MEALFDYITRNVNARTYLVGGAVRDIVLGREPKDFDFEVFGLQPSQMHSELHRAFGHVEVSGEKFAVARTRWSGLNLEFSIPRMDSKSGDRHHHFNVTFVPGATIPQAARRRDFTMNAMYMRVSDSQIIDVFDGAVDLKKKVLRYVDVDTFMDDPLRPLRGMQFAARFSLDPSQELADLCRVHVDEYWNLSLDAVSGEWTKWANARHRSKGLLFLRETGWLEVYPELMETIGCEQHPEWHPEGDVWNHTLQCVDIPRRPLAAYMALCHDLGKPEEEVHHSSAGAPRSFIRSITNRKEIQRAVDKATLHHMDFLDPSPVTPKRIRRLLGKTQFTAEEWLSFCELLRADRFGRAPLNVEKWRVERLAQIQGLGLHILHEHKLDPLILGRHLLARGWEPGPHMGPVLKAAYEAQMEGEFESLEGGLMWLEDYLEGEDDT